KDNGFILVAVKDTKVAGTEPLSWFNGLEQSYS
ncbi:hypothetical protein A2U01_0048412, partial [Trifolium medium]|nr:hypothetical protein [Trifolium medium]